VKTDDIILFTRSQRVKELSWLSSLIYQVKKSKPEDPDFSTDLVFPEALIIKVFNFTCKL
jgi:hypothetical protein